MWFRKKKNFKYIEIKKFQDIENKLFLFKSTEIFFFYNLYQLDSMIELNSNIKQMG